MLDFILSLIYPNVCGFCGKINENSLCEKCKKRLSKKLIYKVQEVQDKYFEKHIYLAHYDGEFRDAILSYKFFDKPYMYKTFTKLILNNKNICSIMETYDIIVAVPIHKKRKGERGYNQSELIAKEIGKNFNKLKYVNILRKTKNNLRQSELKKEERVENVKNVYEIQNKQIIQGKRIILFDDIYTTGNTVYECAKILKQNGSKDILVLTLAR